MTGAEVTFQLGDTVVYATHGTGRIQRIVTRLSEGTPRDFYHIVLDKHRGELWVPVEEALTLGLRHSMQAEDVPQVIECVQREASLPFSSDPGEDPYLWCKTRLREGGVLGLAEVRRFLHDYEGVRSITNPQLRQLRTFVFGQLVSEMAQALGCSQAAAKRVIETALVSPHPVPLPPAPPASVGQC